jgi:septal ring factor EnvC (AmiA/AmiB activator)
MKATRETLQGQLSEYEEQLKGLNSYIKELKAMAAQHGTDPTHFEADLIEAEHNVTYYESEIERLRKELRDSPSAEWPSAGSAVADTILPHTAKQGVGVFLISSLSFVAGVLVGSLLKSPGGGRDRR